jgi:hypothetical protein
MSRLTFIRIPRTNGEDAIIRADMITALLPQKVKVKGSEEDVDEVTIQIGPSIHIHTRLSVERITAAVQNATGGLPMTILLA